MMYELVETKQEVTTTIAWKESPDNILTKNIDRSPEISWRNLSFSIQEKNLLKNCWGKIPSNTLCAIMGPSGAGKSTLLNVLSGRVYESASMKLDVDFFVDQKYVHPRLFRSQVAYVMQEDALFATMTPSEAIFFSGRLRTNLTEGDLSANVTFLMAKLGLDKCSNTFIGNELVKGLSGGQRKLTSVAVELIAHPMILFLDEPTSGLDSYSAMILVALIRDIAKQRCTMVCTIHQPSSEVFALFEMVIFLAGGSVAYCGPVSSMLHYFEMVGFDCPVNYNPADFVINLIQSDLLGKSHFMIPLPADPKGNELAAQVFRHDENDGSSPFGFAGVNYDVIRPPCSLLFELKYLLHRELLNVVRDKDGLIGRFAVTIFLSLLLGIIFFKIGSRTAEDPVDLSSHFGAVSFILIGSMFGSAQPSLLAFPFERPMFIREYSCNTYRAQTYFAAKIIVEALVTFMQMAIQFIILYYMLLLQGNLMAIILIGWALAMCSCSIAVCLGSCISDVKKASELAPLVFVPQLLFVGFFVRINQIPRFLQWAQYLCSLKYAMNLLVIVEFNDSVKGCSVNYMAAQNCKQLWRSNDIDSTDVYIYVLCLVALFVVFRCIGCILLLYKAEH